MLYIYNWDDSVTNRILQSVESCWKIQLIIAIVSFIDAAFEHRECHRTTWEPLIPLLQMQKAAFRMAHNKFVHYRLRSEILFPLMKSNKIRDGR